MKKYIVLPLLGILSVTTHAQEINDVLRYSQTNMNGTARFRAMGGAFTALGGDLSAITINPASSVIFKNNQAGFTLNNQNIKNSSEYFGTRGERKETAFDLNQAGVVFVFTNDDEESHWKKFSLSVNYDNMGSFVDNSVIRGVNPYNSIGNFFLNQAGGITLSDLTSSAGEQRYFRDGDGRRYLNAVLGYETYILDPLSNSPENADYYSNVPIGSYEQVSYTTQSGYNGKMAFNLATQYTDKFYFGLNLNAHFVDYERSNAFFESNDNPVFPDGETTRNIWYQSDVYTYGTGFSFQLGAIAKVTDELRFGITYESPTWYKLKDDLILHTTAQNVDSSENSLPQTSLTIEAFLPEYKIQTPSKYTFGGAYVFGNRGLISVDYSIKDYSAAKLKPSDAIAFRRENTLIADVLDVASEIRIGAETRIKQWSLRAGYNYEQSPYKNGRTIGDLQQYSLGFGYNFGATKLDMAYSGSKRDYSQGLFGIGSDPAKTTIKNNSIFLTLLFEF